MAYDGSRFYSQYLPGGILISFLGLKTGWTPWLHALFAAGVAAMTYLSGRRICDRGTALLGSALLLISPCFLLLGASFMDHVPTAFFLMTALWLGLRDLARPGPWNAAALGFCVGCACITRPLTALGWCGPLLVVWTIGRRRTFRGQWRAWWAPLFAWAVPVAFLLFFNFKTTGNPFRFGYSVADPRMHSLGFTAANGHTPARGLAQQLSNLDSLSHWLYFWPITSFFFILFLFLSGSDRRNDRLLLLPVFGTLLCYFFYPYQDFGFSPRFLLESVPLLALLTARGIVRFVDFGREHWATTEPRMWPRAAFAVLLGLSSCAVYPAWEVFSRFGREAAVSVNEAAPLFRALCQDEKASVFVTEDWRQHAILANVLSRGGAEFLPDTDPQGRMATMARHPGRRFFLVGGTCSPGGLQAWPIDPATGQPVFGEVPAERRPERDSP